MVSVKTMVRILPFLLIFLSFHIQAQDDTNSPQQNDSLQPIIIKNRQVSVMTGPLISNHLDQFGAVDIDGPADIFGEVDIINDGYFVDADLSWRFEKGHSVYGKYSFSRLNMNRLAVINGNLWVDDQYPFVRHQAYVRGEFGSDKDFWLVPAFHMLFNRSETVVPSLNPDSNWIFPVQMNQYTGVIGYLGATKKTRYIDAVVFTAISSLNDTRQWQGGIQIIVYPLGNVNLVISSKLLDHRDNSNDNLVLEEKIGVALFKNLYAELEGSFGRMNNYYDDQAGDVYDMYGRLNFKGTGRITFSPGERLQIIFEYRYLDGEGKYSYLMPSEDQKVTGYESFQSQLYSIGVSWSF